MASQATIRWIALTALVSLAGCSFRPAPVDPVHIDPDEAAGSLISEHDANNDGSLGFDELASIVGMSECMKKFDANGDQKVDATELSENLKRIFDGRIGMLSASCRVTHKRRPLAGAIVYFVPLPMFAEQMEVAGAVTGSSGYAELSVREEDLPENAPKIGGLIRPGLYFVEVTHPQVKVPEKYNKKTILGYEVTPQTVAGGPIEIPLEF